MRSSASIIEKTVAKQIMSNNGPQKLYRLNKSYVLKFVCDERGKTNVFGTTTNGTYT